jgi:hypothetical protein
MPQAAIPVLQQTLRKHISHTIQQSLWNVFTSYHKYGHINLQSVWGTTPVMKNGLWLSFEISQIKSQLQFPCQWFYTSYWVDYHNFFSIANLNAVRVMALGTIFLPHLKQYITTQLITFLHLLLEQVYKISIIHFIVSYQLRNLVPFYSNWCHAPNICWITMGQLLCF